MANEYLDLSDPDARSLDAAKNLIETSIDEVNKAADDIINRLPPTNNYLDNKIMDECAAQEVKDDGVLIISDIDFAKEKLREAKSNNKTEIRELKQTIKSLQIEERTKLFQQLKEATLDTFSKIGQGIADYTKSLATVSAERAGDSFDRLHKELHMQLNKERLSIRQCNKSIVDKLHTYRHNEYDRLIEKAREKSLKRYEKEKKGFHPFKRSFSRAYREKMRDPELFVKKDPMFKLAVADINLNWGLSLKIADKLKEYTDRKVEQNRNAVKEDREYLESKKELAPFKEQFRDKLAEVKQERVNTPPEKNKNRSDMER